MPGCGLFSCEIWDAFKSIIYFPSLETEQLPKAHFRGHLRVSQIGITCRLDEVKITTFSPKGNSEPI